MEDFTDEQMAEIEEAYEQIQKEKYIAEYKQKLIKRIKGLYKRNTPMGMIEKINYNNAIRDVLDEVEAVIKEEVKE